MVTRGGEVDFVKRMIDESLQLRDRIQWYTSMLGKLSSVSVLVETLIKQGNHNFAVTEFEQGSKTKRWAVAWSWGDRRPSMVRQTSDCHDLSCLTNIRMRREESLVCRKVFSLFQLTTVSHFEPIRL
jgi:23S rRNA A1618 N6-methylase RlmF